MEMSLTALLYQIQNILFLASGLLILCVAIPLYLEKGSLAGAWASLFSVSVDKSSVVRDAKSEKRRAPRNKSKLPIDLGFGGGTFIPQGGRLHDISPRGACIDSHLSLIPGEKILARLRSPQDGLLQISAKVVWQKRHADTFLYGLEFQSVDAIPLHLA